MAFSIMIFSRKRLRRNFFQKSHATAGRNFPQLGGLISRALEASFECSSGVMITGNEKNRYCTRIFGEGLMVGK